MSGYHFATDLKESKQEYHVKGVFIFLICVSGGFLFFTVLLLVYHAFLIMTNQTTWEHSRRPIISYLKIYDKDIFPFDYGIWNNIKMIMLHENKVRDWVLRHPQLLRARNGFNYFVNEHYNCC